MANDEAKEGARRQRLFTKLLNVLGSIKADGSSGTYVTGGQIAVNDAEVLIDLLHVQGVGELHLPLSNEDAVQVRKLSTYVDGSAIVIDGEIRSAWQLDSSLFSFPQGPLFTTKTVQLIAAEAGKALGLHGIQVIACLSNLLLYEHDDPLQFLRDMKDMKEQPGISTMMIPIPTKMGFKGGALVAAQGLRLFTFNFTWNKSKPFFYTTFFANQKLKKDNPGTQLFLVFNLFIRQNFICKSLVLEDSTSDDSIPNSDFLLARMKNSFTLVKAEAVLQPWVHKLNNSKEAFGLPEKLAIPLGKKYCEEELYFNGLEGEDHIIAEVLYNCRDSAQRPLLDMFLCIVTLHQSGAVAPTYGERTYSPPPSYVPEGCYDAPSDDEDDGFGENSSEEDYGHTMGEIDDEDLEADCWIGSDDELCEVDMIIDSDDIVVAKDKDWRSCFDIGDPDKVEYEDSWLDHWYYKPMLVICPRDNDLDDLDEGISVSDPNDAIAEPEKKKRRHSPAPLDATNRVSLAIS